MAPVKRRPRARSHHRMNLPRRKPNIPELVYKFLRIAEDGGRESASHSCSGTCGFCWRQEPNEELRNSVDSRRTGGKAMANKQRKDRGRNPKSRGVKRHRTTKDQALSSCMHRCHGEDGLRKVKRYIQKALDFGVESGYLIPRDSTFKVLRVSSDLMNGKSERGKVRTISQERERGPRRTPSRFEEYQVQDAGRRRRRRRRGRRRSRSGSKRGRRGSHRRGRKRSRSQNPEEDGYEVEADNNEEKRNIRREDADRDPENARLNKPDGEKTVVKRDDDGSELSVDEEETDDEEERKREDTTKS